MQFEESLATIKSDINFGMRLPFWKSDVAIFCQYPDKNSKMTAPYLYVDSRFGRVPWRETFIEMFNPHWEIIEKDEYYDADWNEAPTTLI